MWLSVRSGLGHIPVIPVSQDLGRTLSQYFQTQMESVVRNWPRILEVMPETTMSAMSKLEALCNDRAKRNQTKPS
jgi:hypothetical protein